MATIDQLDIGVYVLYAKRTQLVEQIQKDYRISESSTIPPQTMIIDLAPKLSELDILLGVVPPYTPFAYFFRPKSFRKRRRSPFTFSRILPTLADDETTEDDILDLIDSVEDATEEISKEKKALSNCFNEIKTINGWVKFIVGRMGQFIQG